MPDKKAPPEEVHPFVPCSRNLRRRTGFWLGIEAGELMAILCISMIPDFAYRLGLLEKPNLLAGVIISGIALGFVILFKRNKQPHYFTLWLSHHFIHPNGWRAPKSVEWLFPIVNDSVGMPISNLKFEISNQPIGSHEKMRSET